MADRVYTALIKIAVRASNDAEACDAVAELLRKSMALYTPQSSFLDWRYADQNTTTNQWGGPNDTGIAFDPDYKEGQYV